MLNSYQEILRKAVAYYRHSAEDKQENSVPIQRQQTIEFAERHNIEIIHEEVDEGISGLLANRPGFERLFADWIQNPKAPTFDFIFVYDVSRWGRFQDQDQAAHFTFLCKKHGKEVVYVARGFPDKSNSLITSLETSIQRYMAAEYSRQLSDKVFHGCVKVSEQGYSAGGKAAYGMTRLLLDVNRKPLRTLNVGEHKQVANERVSFIPKNDSTTDTVRAIFDLFVNNKASLHTIVARLNQKNSVDGSKKSWNRSSVINVLTNEVYTGTRLYNKTWARLKQKPHANPRSEWVVVADAFKGIIDKVTFRAAQERLYWVLQHNWRKGIIAINRAKKIIFNDIYEEMLKRGFPEYLAFEILKDLPIIFSIKTTKEKNSLWCFVISEKTRRFEKVLGVSVVPDEVKIIEELFLLSIDQFAKTDFLVLTSDNIVYNETKINNREIEETIMHLIMQVKRIKNLNIPGL